jgi:hypothetical protein
MIMGQSYYNRLNSCAAQKLPKQTNISNSQADISKSNGLHVEIGVIRDIY